MFLFVLLLCINIEVDRKRGKKSEREGCRHTSITLTHTCEPVKAPATPYLTKKKWELPHISSTPSKHLCATSKSLTTTPLASILHPSPSSPSPTVLASKILNHHLSRRAILPRPHPRTNHPPTLTTSSTSPHRTAHVAQTPRSRLHPQQNL